MTLPSIYPGKSKHGQTSRSPGSQSHTQSLTVHPPCSPCPPRPSPSSPGAFADAVPLPESSSLLSCSPFFSSTSAQPSVQLAGLVREPASSTMHSRKPDLLFTAFTSFHHISVCTIL